MEENQFIEVTNDNLTSLLTVYSKQVEQELKDILEYWLHNARDIINGGFVGRIDENNVPHADAVKGAVLNCRILWAFSEAFKVNPDPLYLKTATDAFNYLIQYFFDKESGGIYWTVTASGEPLDTKKQVYAIAFAVYASTAYFEASNDNAAKEWAIRLYKTIEKYSYDKVYQGYFEAFDKDWSSIADLRLSHKDANEKKTANTHLHVLEAYTCLLGIWPDMNLKQQLEKLIENFLKIFIDENSGHLRLFFNEKWATKSTLISYGHDIEAAWLLVVAATATGNKALEQEVKMVVKKLAFSAAKGLDADGGLWYEYEPAENHINKEKHWWVQAEAMVGFFNHWQITGDQNFLERSYRSWLYVDAFIKDKTYGEWLWGRNADGTIMQGQDKVGLWKCPYHNARACIEIMGRIKNYLHR